MQAVTAAAERLVAATYRTEAAAQLQQAERSHRPQEVVTTLPHWQLHHHWRHVMLQQQQLPTAAHVVMAAAVDYRLQTLRSIREHCNTLAFNVVNR
jgi:hypothetical protein